MSFGGEGSEAARKMHQEGMQQFDESRKPQLTTVLEPYPDSLGSMLHRHWKEEAARKNPQWQDHVIEPMPQMLHYTAGQEWYVRLQGAAALMRVTVIDVTPKTVELRGVASYRQPVRYAKTDVEFVEQIA